MKRVISMVLTAVMTLGIAGCSNGASTSSTGAQRVKKLNKSKRLFIS